MKTPNWQSSRKIFQEDVIFQMNPAIYNIQFTKLIKSDNWLISVYHFKIFYLYISCLLGISLC